MSTTARIHLSLALLASLLAGCTNLVPRTYLPYPLTNKTFADPAKVVTIPLPVIQVDPNEGDTYGTLAAFLLHNGRDEISTLVVPQVNYNHNFGTTFQLYGLFYPTQGRSWDVTLSKSARINEEYELRLRDATLLEKRLEVTADLDWNTNGSRRFFGFGARSSEDRETNFTEEERTIELFTGYTLFDHLQVGIGNRFRRVNVTRGAVFKLPFAGDVFSEREVPGLGGFTAHAQRIAATYRTVDVLETPERGLYGSVWGEWSFKALGSAANYTRYGVDLIGYFPIDAARYVTAARAGWRQTEGLGVPFLEMSSLGGENTLRGYGKNRFVDKGYLAFGLEERIRLFRWPLFNVHTDWQLAPFVEAGAVMRNLAHVGFSDFRVVPGVGFRAVVRPNVVGHVDIGFGDEGVAAFMGLGYPF